MKAFTAVIPIAVMALPFCAAAQDLPNTTTTVLAAPVNEGPQESPLVRAAKATGRLNKKPTAVITNETLVRISNRFAEMDAASATANAPKTAVQSAAQTLKKLKSSSTDYYKTFGPASKPAPQPLTEPPTEGQRAPIAQPASMTSAQPGTMSTTSLNQMSTTQFGSASTTQLDHVGTAQPAPAGTVKPPER